MHYTLSTSNLLLTNRWASANLEAKYDQFTELHEFVRVWAVQQNFYLGQTVPVTFYRFEDLLFYPWEIVTNVLQSTGFWELAGVDGTESILIELLR